MGDLKFFLGLEIARSPNGIFVLQRSYALQMVADVGLLACKLAKTPMQVNLKLSKKEEESVVYPAMYERIVGRLLYLTITRSIVSYVVNKLGQFMSDPTEPHLNVVDHVLQYVKATLALGLFFSSKNDLQLKSFADAANWGACSNTRGQFQGFVLIWVIHLSHGSQE